MRRGGGLLGTRGVPGRSPPLGRGGCAGAAVSPRHTVGAFPRAKKVFPAKIFPHAMYKEARQAGFAKLVDKAIFGPIVWWV